MKSRFILLVLAISLAGCEGCEEAPDPLTELEKLPPPTQQGKHTFGCLVNGKAWVTETSIDSWGFYQEGVLSIGASLVTKEIDQGMGFVIRDLGLNESIYVLNDSIYSYANFGDGKSKCTYSCADGRGEVLITNLDRENWIISGTFRFTVSKANCDTIRITDGRFDIAYAP